MIKIIDTKNQKLKLGEKLKRKEKNGDFHTLYVGDLPLNQSIFTFTRDNYFCNIGCIFHTLLIDAKRGS